MHCHLPKSSALQQLSLAASHSEAFYSLWISVKSLSSHTALCSAPLFGTLGGHFSSNRGKERSSVQQALAVFVFMHVMGISLSGVVLNISNDPCRQAQSEYVLEIYPIVEGVCFLGCCVHCSVLNILSQLGNAKGRCY